MKRRLLVTTVVSMLSLDPVASGPAAGDGKELAPAAPGTVFRGEPPTVAGPKGERVERLPMTRTTQALFRGDFSAEMGIGCSNAAGTSGGPNEAAVHVVASALVVPFRIQYLTYNVFTQVSPNITSHSAAAWSGVSGGGTLIDVHPGAPYSQGNHTFFMPFPGLYPINNTSFYFGFRQLQSNVGMRWGVDTSAGGGTSFLRAPNCGLSAFATLDSLGQPGNWVFRAIGDDTLKPVELYDFSVE